MGTELRYTGAGTERRSSLHDYRGVEERYRETATRSHRPVSHLASIVVPALTLRRCKVAKDRINTADWALQTIAICTQDNNYILQDGFKSFPSGHSSGMLMDLCVLVTQLTLNSLVCWLVLPLALPCGKTACIGCQGRSLAYLCRHGSNARRSAHHRHTYHGCPPSSIRCHLRCDAGHTCVVGCIPTVFPASNGDVAEGTRLSHSCLGPWTSSTSQYQPNDYG